MIKNTIKIIHAFVLRKIRILAYEQKIKVYHVYLQKKNFVYACLFLYKSVYTNK